MNYLQKLQAALEHKENLLEQLSKQELERKKLIQELSDAHERLDEKVDKLIQINSQKKTAEQSLSWMKTSFDNQQAAMTKLQYTLAVLESTVKAQKWVISLLVTGLVLETILLVRQVL